MYLRKEHQEAFDDLRSQARFSTLSVSDKIV